MSQWAMQYALLNLMSHLTLVPTDISGVCEVTYKCEYVPFLRYEPHTGESDDCWPCGNDFVLIGAKIVESL